MLPRAGLDSGLLRLDTEIKNLIKFAGKNAQDVHREVRASNRHL